MVKRGARAAGGFMSDFQQFLMQGNIIDLAIGVIIGGAFGAIIKSLVEDILTPVILQPALQAAGVDQLQALTFNGIKYGVFLAAVLNFIVIALAMFVLIRSLASAKKRLMREEEAAAAETPDPLVESNARLADAVDRLTRTMQSRV